MYDAINEDAKLPNIEYPDTDASKAIVEFHACKFGLLKHKGSNTCSEYFYATFEVTNSSNIETVS